MDERFAVGAPLRPFVRLGTIEVWAHFAAVNHEIAAHHMDDAVAQHEGFPGAFAMAPLTFSYVQTMLRDWLDGDGRIVRVAIELRRPFLRGRTLTATGTVVSAREEAGETLLDLEVWADDDEGTRLVQGTAVVALTLPVRS